MAEAPLDVSDCFLCHEKLKDPVSLGCEHSFCYNCLQQHWDLNTARDCPKCRRRSSKDLPMTFALKEKIEFSPRQTESSEQQTGQEEVTRKRPEDDILFVSDKSEPFSQTEDSAKEKLQSEVQKKLYTENIRKHFEDMLQHTERQAQSCEDRIRKQIEHLHLILAQEEELCLNSLRKEKEEKTLRIQLKLKDIDAKLSSVSQRIAEEQVQTGSSDPLSDIRDSNEPDPPEPEPGLLINEARVLGNLGYRVWQKMGTVIKHSPVVLDPNTANSFLHLSEDLTSVRREDTEQSVPLNPERFTSFTSVLGSEGFSSGTHRWDVEVGDHPEWTIGLVKESVKHDTRYYASPQNGLWCLMHHNDKYLGCIGETLKLKRRPERIRVELDYEAGQVSFSDPKDMSLIYCHRDTFTEKLFPYFFVGQVEGATVAKDIKIHPCPVNPEEFTSAGLTPEASEAQQLPSLESKVQTLALKVSEIQQLRRLESKRQRSAGLALKASEIQQLRRLESEQQTSAGLALKTSEAQQLRRLESRVQTLALKVSTIQEPRRLESKRQTLALKVSEIHQLRRSVSNLQTSARLALKASKAQQLERLELALDYLELELECLELELERLVLELQTSARPALKASKERQLQHLGSQQRPSARGLALEASKAQELERLESKRQTLALKVSKAQELERLELEVELLELELQTSAGLALEDSTIPELQHSLLKLQESKAKRKQQQSERKKQESETKAEVPEMFTPKSSSDPGPSQSPEKEPQTVLKEEQEPPAETSDTQSHV